MKKKELERQLKESRQRELAFAYERDQLLLRLKDKRCGCHSQRHQRDLDVGAFINGIRDGIDQAGEGNPLD